MAPTFALQFLAVATHEAPDYSIADKSLAQHLAEKLRYFLVTPHPYEDGTTREPEALGGIGGWTHNAAAQSLLLARRTPQVWALLSSDEKQRADLLMQALAVAAHFSLDDDNNFYVLLDGASHYHRSWNPNHVAGYVGVIIAASLYFGPEPLDEFFETFDFDQFEKRLDAVNFQNIRRCWTYNPAIPKLLMEGGTIALGEKSVLARGVPTRGAGVRNRFTYDGIPLSQPWAMHRAEAVRLYSKAVRTQVTIHGKDTSRLLERKSKATVSPWEGQMGMCHEFETTDWDGLRTSAIYAYEGVMIDIGTASTLKILGEWKSAEGGDMIERRMGVGMADLRFKASEGYRGWSGGKENFIWWEKDLEPVGASYVFNLWESYFAPPPVPTQP
ncbi:hypothetical protein CMV30_12045 [Nibricoccus aquaticus]|uniref:Uncharacterized protein n=2 Tax=Nibricoccus aquaticus TaxID=2576891 RepID=A0A290QBR2_9BACT|nr:hypothetical protein CMV30_12045 [Nibricoccus aquaticus]